MFQYLYDGEGRICAVKNLTVGSMTGYLYDAEGNRIAKGSITTMSCDPSANGFSSTNDFVLGPGGEQITEMAVEGDNTLTWYHTNVWAAGRLIAPTTMMACTSISTIHEGRDAFRPTRSEILNRPAPISPSEMAKKSIVECARIEAKDPIEPGVRQLLVRADLAHRTKKKALRCAPEPSQYLEHNRARD